MRRLLRGWWLTLAGTLAMAGVAGIGLLAMAKPYPLVGFQLSEMTFLFWSDGSRTRTNGGPIPSDHRAYGPFVQVKWSDGSQSWYLDRGSLDRDLWSGKPGRCLKVLRSDPSAKRRGDAALALARNANRLASDAVVPALVSALGDTNANVRRSVVSALDVYGERSDLVVPAIIKALEDEDSVVRIMAAYGLGSSGPRSAQVTIPALVRTLEDKNPEVQRSAAKALVSLKSGERAVPALVKSLQSLATSKTQDLKWRSRLEGTIDVLGSIGPAAKAAVPTLIEISEFDDQRIQVTAAAALLAIGELEVAIPILEDADTDENEDASARSIAYRALRKHEAKSDELPPAAPETGGEPSNR